MFSHVERYYSLVSHWWKKVSMALFSKGDQGYETILGSFVKPFRAYELNHLELVCETVLGSWVKPSRAHVWTILSSCMRIYWAQVWDHTELSMETSLTWDMRPSLAHRLNPSWDQIWNHPAFLSSGMRTSWAQAWNYPTILSSYMRPHWVQSWPSYHPELSHWDHTVLSHDQSSELSCGEWDHP
jgi:hypothetical protein